LKYCICTIDPIFKNESVLESAHIRPIFSYL